MRKVQRTILPAILAPILAFSLCAAVFAADSTIDYTRTGSISIVLKEQSGERSPVSGAEITLYRVGKIDGGATLRYSPTFDFEPCGINLADPRADGLAESLAVYAKENMISGTVKKTDREGRAVFDGLSPGLYLTVQSNALAGYYPIEPFLASAPTTSLDGREWVYDIEASPKVEIKKPPSPPHVTTSDSLISFIVPPIIPIVPIIPITPDVPSTPVIPGAPSTPIIPGAPSTPIIPGAPSTPVIPGAPSTPVIPGAPHAPSAKSPLLIQTGQLNWLAPVLATIGVLLFAIGWALTYLKGKKDRET